MIPVVLQFQYESGKKKGTLQKFKEHPKGTTCAVI